MTPGQRLVSPLERAHKRTYALRDEITQLLGRYGIPLIYIAAADGYHQSSIAMTVDFRSDGIIRYETWIVDGLRLEVLLRTHSGEIELIFEDRRPSCLEWASIGIGFSPREFSGEKISQLDSISMEISHTATTEALERPRGTRPTSHVKRALIGAGRRRPPPWTVLRERIDTFVRNTTGRAPTPDTPFSTA